MPEPRTCHLPNNMASVCFGQAKSLERQATDCVVSYITELEGRR
jgi:hypothetical protein